MKSPMHGPRLFAFALFLSTAAPILAQTPLTFTPLAAMPDGGRYGAGYCQDQNFFYSVGGGSPATAFTGDVFRYDPAANSWGAGPFSRGQVSPQRFGTAAILAPNTSTSLLFVLNGAASTGPVAIATGQNVRASDGVAAGSFGNPTPASSAGTAVWNGLLYAYGGQAAPTPSTYTNQLRAYNPATGVWATLAPMAEAKSVFGAAVNGKIYIFGGFDGMVNSNRVDAYDIATNTWQALGTLPTTVASQAVAVLGELIWLVGDFTNQAYLAAYDTRTGQLRTFTSNLPPRRNAAAAVAGGFLYVWGGNTASSNATTLADLWRADVQSIATASPRARVRPPLQAYPSPSATGRLTVTPPAPAAAQLVVSDAQGRTVRRLAVPAGAASVEVDLADQAAGLYLLRWQGAGRPAAACRVVRQ
ncbi:kelch repeat-containing protein [Hymenobacter sp.]|uniref:Kelch repeat-containing protein n=1 Tax=Hymenobacter sp. TaxID=1898978 RepID=UPI00286A9A76|nr:kelch repeat-containing protein [Hymenobacter sp.]